MSRRRATGSPSRAPGGAREVALRLLARSGRSESELRRALDGSGFEPGVIDAALAELRAAGWIDDRALARERCATAAARGGRAPQRIVRELVERGVDEAVARAAWQETVEREDLAEERLFDRDLERLLKREGKRRDRGTLRRVYNALLRAGWEPERVSAALEPLARDEDTTTS